MWAMTSRDGETSAKHENVESTPTPPPSLPSLSLVVLIRGRFYGFLPFFVSWWMLAGFQDNNHNCLAESQLQNPKLRHCCLLSTVHILLSLKRSVETLFSSPRFACFKAFFGAFLKGKCKYDFHMSQHFRNSP